MDIDKILLKLRKNYQRKAKLVTIALSLLRGKRTDTESQKIRKAIKELIIENVEIDRLEEELKQYKENS